MISLSEIAWLAGLLEGEGCFLFHHGASVVLKMTDKDVVERAASLMGVKVIARDPKNIKWKRTYDARVNGYQAVAWMLTIYSFMGERRKKKIIEIIAKWKTMKMQPRTQLKTYATCHPDRLVYLGVSCYQCYTRQRDKRYWKKHGPVVNARRYFNLQQKRRCGKTADLFQCQ
jgi:hypothetical protein